VGVLQGRANTREERLWFCIGQDKIGEKKKKRANSATTTSLFRNMRAKPGEKARGGRGTSGRTETGSSEGEKKEEKYGIPDRKVDSVGKSKTKSTSIYTLKDLDDKENRIEKRESA